MTELISPAPLASLVNYSRWQLILPPLLSPGYKPFLNIIKPQLQKLSEITEEQVQPDTFQPVTMGKTPEQTSPRAEESRGSSSRASISQSENGSNSVVSRKEEDTTQADEEEPFQDGAYDCSVSWQQQVTSQEAVLLKQRATEHTVTWLNDFTGKEQGSKTLS